jgi:hypothetical protein
MNFNQFLHRVRFGDFSLKGLQDLKQKNPELQREQQQRLEDVISLPHLTIEMNKTTCG